MNYGLTSDEVNIRIEQGQVNIDNSTPKKTVKGIIAKNVFTLFNIVNFALGVAIFFTGQYKNMLFLGVAFFNIVVGIVQEIRSKRAVEKLSIISNDKVRAIRDKREILIDREQLVIDDVILLKAGFEVPADCVVVSGGCYANESLLTGESNLVNKEINANMLSGSFVSSGKCYAKIIHIGEDNYASKINKQAKYYKKLNSEILLTVRKIIKVVTLLLFPIGALLFYNQYGIAESLNEAIVSTVAALIGMIPEGLVLLTSSIMAISVIRLAKMKVLVQDMYCIESLARVDVLCLDKTGTITTDKLVFDSIKTINSTDDEVKSLLSSFAHCIEDDNATMMAIREKFSVFDYRIADKVSPFSSEKKCSSITIGKEEFILGAAEFILNDSFINEKDEADKLSEKYRVLTLIKKDDKITALAFILLEDELRENAKETIKYFIEQNVSLKIISGDSVPTIKKAAMLSGVPEYEKAVDCTTFNSDEELKEAVERYTIFGRVTPKQKEVIIFSLKQNGHTVAMTGDGVNDVLALKKADCSISIASGSEAAKCVSEIVLVDNNFASLPKIVNEGRRTINNIERSSCLFLVKNIFSIILSTFFAIFSFTYPFVPIQLSFVGAFTIGIPSFILALEPNYHIISGRYFRNIITNAIPAGLTVSINVIILSVLQKFLSLSDIQFSTLAVSITAFVLMSLIMKISFPPNKLRSLLVIFCTICLLIGLIFFNSLFSITYFSFEMIVVFISLAVLSLIMFALLTRVCYEIKTKKATRNIG